MAHLSTLIRRTFLAVLLSAPVPAAGQSLVFNPGLEAANPLPANGCPTMPSQIFLAPGWTSPKATITPDYFNACATVAAWQMPVNAFGSEPDNAGGQGYAGIAAFFVNTPHGREYIQAPLVAPLQLGITYEVSFDVSIAEVSGVAIDRIGAYLGDKITPANQVLFEIPQIASTGMIANTNGWTTISGDYVAAGGEAFITIGNFGDAALTNTQLQGGSGIPDVAYYYIDNVMVWPKSDIHRVYTVKDTNELVVVDLDANPCASITIGVTEDANGTVRRIRGLTHDGRLMYGVTREGDLVTVDPTTAETELIYSIAAGNAVTNFWGGLTYHSSGVLHTTTAFDGRELVELDIVRRPITEVVLGSTGKEILGLDHYPLSAPLMPPTFDGVHPNSSTLYASNHIDGNIMTLNQNTGVAEATFSNYVISDKPQSIAFDPSTGILYGLEDEFPSSNNAGLFTMDFADTTGTLLCELPFSYVENGGGGSGTFGWGGLAFIPETDPAAMDVIKVCVSGPSTGIGWSWWLDNRIGDVAPVLPVGSAAQDIAAAFVESLQDFGFHAYIDSFDDTCLTILAPSGAQISVGSYQAPNFNCTVTNNPSGCTVNPTITEAQFLPLPQPTSVDPLPAPQLGRVSAYPNPLNPATTIRFELPRSAEASVNVYDLRGKLVRRLTQGYMSEGIQEVRWNGMDNNGAVVASGVYVVRVATEGQVQSVKVALLK